MAHPLVAQTVVALGSTSPLQTWIKGNVFPLLLLIVIFTCINLARQKKTKAILEVVAGMLIALMVLGLAVGTNADTVGTALADLFIQIVSG